MRIEFIVLQKLSEKYSVIMGNFIIIPHYDIVSAKLKTLFKAFIQLTPKSIDSCIYLAYPYAVQYTTFLRAFKENIYSYTKIWK
jgi:hypothetical protein